jgi:hypothetical protein
VSADPHIAVATLARTAPHLCGDELCPGHQNELRLRLLDRIVGATIDDLRAQRIAMDATLAPIDFLKRVAAHAGAVISVCSWCQKGTGLKDGEGRSGISHGICADCHKTKWRL